MLRVRYVPCLSSLPVILLVLLQLVLCCFVCSSYVADFLFMLFGHCACHSSLFLGFFLLSLVLALLLLLPLFACSVSGFPFLCCSFPSLSLLFLLAS